MVGLYAKVLRLKAASLRTPPDSGGPAVVVTGEAGDQIYTPEVWGQHGLYSMPPDDTMGIRVPVGNSERFAPILATHHYETPRPTLAKGEAALASTSADGTEIKAKIVARSDGTLEINGTGKFLVTHAELDAALQTFLTALKAHLTAAGDPSAGTLTVDISTAKAQTLKTGG